MTEQTSETSPVEPYVPPKTLSGLSLGDRIKDNDPRMPNRVLEITDLDVDRDGGMRVAARLWGMRGAGLTRLSRHFIHLDGKPRRSGWSVVP